MMPGRAPPLRPPLVDLLDLKLLGLHLNTAVDAIGPESDFTIENNEKVVTQWPPSGHLVVTKRSPGGHQVGTRWSPSVS